MTDQSREPSGDPPQLDTLYGRLQRHYRGEQLLSDAHVAPVWDATSATTGGKPAAGRRTPRPPAPTTATADIRGHPI